MKHPWGLMADLHLHPWSAFAQTSPNGMNNRLAGLLSEMERCAAEVHEAGGDTVVIAGDVFHVRGSVSPIVANATRDLLAETVRKYGTRWIIMPGNHDLETKHSTRLSSAVTGLEMDGVTIVNETTRIDDMVLVPWIEHTADLKKVLADCELDDKTDLILHAPIDGVIDGLPLHGIDPAFLKDLGARWVFAGHYHNHKVMLPGVVSIGALAHHTWSDVKSSAGFLLVEGDQFEWRASNLPQFIDLDNLVGMDKFEVTMTVDRNYVRVKVESGKASEVEQVRQELLEMGAAGVIVQAKPKAASRPVTATGSVAPTASGASLEVSVTDFAAARYAADPLIDKIKTEALSVLSAV